MSQTFMANVMSRLISRDDRSTVANPVLILTILANIVTEIYQILVPCVPSTAIAFNGLKISPHLGDVLSYLCFEKSAKGLAALLYV